MERTPIQTHTHSSILPHSHYETKGVHVLMAETHSKQHVSGLENMLCLETKKYGYNFFPMTYKLLFLSAKNVPNMKQIHFFTKVLDFCTKNPIWRTKVQFYWEHLFPFPHTLSPLNYKILLHVWLTFGKIEKRTKILIPSFRDIPIYVSVEFTAAKQRMG